ncbi:MAG: alpha-hydroxy acid oxidase [Beijerinckiaceae bacterium]
MDDTSAAAKPATPQPTAAEMDERLALHRRFPTSHDLRRAAQRNMPNFAFEYMDGGAGADTGIARNWRALDAVELLPRYGVVVAPPSAETTIFGHRYSAPVGIAPIGGPGTAFPGAETYFAKAAQKANVPYTLGLLSGIDMEQGAELAGDVLWYQLYRFSRDNHRIGLDLTRRAQAAGVKVLMLTIDTPIRTTRPREVRSGIMNPFKLTMRLRQDAMMAPRWLASLRKHGVPRFAALKPYMGGDLSLEEAAAFIRREQGGAFTWDEVKLYRDVWKGPMMLKGILHPADAQKAVDLGVDGILVSNHGGRQIEALPSSIDVLPAIRQQVGDRATIILDSGIRSGVDVARAVALGADGALAGKSFLWSLGALGERGPGHLIHVYTEDVRATLGQLGCLSVEDLRKVGRRHPGAYRLEDFAPPA